MMPTCPFCDGRLSVGPCMDGGYSMGCSCAFQGPEEHTKKRAKEVVTAWLGTVNQLRAVVAEKLHRRRCHDCGNVAYHADAVVPYVCCDECGSQDTRRTKKTTEVKCSESSI